MIHDRQNVLQKDSLAFHSPSVITFAQFHYVAFCGITNGIGVMLWRPPQFHTKTRAPLHTDIVGDTNDFAVKYFQIERSHFR